MATSSTPKPEPEQKAFEASAEGAAQTTVTQPSGRERVEAYDKDSGTKLLHKVPRSWLDGRFPNLSETPSSKKAGN